MCLRPGQCGQAAPALTDAGACTRRGECALSLGEVAAAAAVAVAVWVVAVDWRRIHRPRDVGARPSWVLGDKETRTLRCTRLSTIATSNATRICQAQLGAG